MRMIRKILKTLVGIFTIFGIAGFGKVLIHNFIQQSKHPQPLVIFLLGILVFTVIWFYYLVHRGNFWSTLEHELTHALFATLFLKRIHSISASRKRGGVIAIEGGNSIIALSPYFFPLGAIVILLLKLLAPVQLKIYFIFLLGFAYQFHIINLFREFHFEQSDIRASGYLFSTLFISFCNLIFLGLVLAGIEGSWQQLYLFMKDGLTASFGYLKLLYPLLSGQVIKVNH
jgi:hypothetical protein